MVCKKDFEHCIGGCAGDLTSTLKYDFNTMIAISELNPDVLGEDGFYAAAADCNVRQGVIEVPLFEGGDACVLTRTLTQHPAPHSPKAHGLRVESLRAVSRRLSSGCKRDVRWPVPSHTAP